MPYETEHAARLVDPDDIDPESYHRINISDGVDKIRGDLKSTGETVDQSVRFDADKFTEAEAKQWLDDHDLSYIKFEAAVKEQQRLFKQVPLFVAFNPSRHKNKS